MSTKAALFSTMVKAGRTTYFVDVLEAKNGNKYLAWAYVEAAHFAQRYSPRAQAWFASKAARTGRVVAVNALACKLAKAVFYVLRDEVDFDENKLFG